MLKTITTKRIFAIAGIFVCTSLCWGVLGTNLLQRSTSSFQTLGETVTSVWGPAMTQYQPVVYDYETVTGSDTKQFLQPVRSDVSVGLNYEPIRKGLLSYRAYLVDFHAEYTLENTGDNNRVIYFDLPFPSSTSSYSDVTVMVNGSPVSTAGIKAESGISQSIDLAPAQTAKIEVAYKSRGTNYWGYSFGDRARARNLHLAMTTNFADIDFPAGTGSPTTRVEKYSGWELTWSYPDVINAPAIGMNMPAIINPGHVASRISFFSPISLLFFFTVLLLLCVIHGVDLHPMNYFFLAAGCFAFQLLFAYMADLMPLLLAFSIAAMVSIALVYFYLSAAAGRKLARMAAIAQFTYMVLFSYSFFFEGLTGLTITIGAIITLALLMNATARVNWSALFAGGFPVTPEPAKAS